MVEHENGKGVKSVLVRIESALDRCVDSEQTQVQLLGEQNELARDRTHATSKILPFLSSTAVNTERQTSMAQERTALTREQTRLSTRSTELANIRTDLGRERTFLSEQRTDLAVQRTEMSRRRTSLAEGRTNRTGGESDAAGSGAQPPLVAENRVGPGENLPGPDPHGAGIPHPGHFTVSVLWTVSLEPLRWSAGHGQLLHGGLRAERLPPGPEQRAQTGRSAGPGSRL